MTENMHETVAGRSVDAAGTLVWQIMCGNHARFWGMSPEAAEEIWLKHVRFETGRAPETLPEWKP